MSSPNLALWARLTARDFEDLVFWLLHREGFFNLAWHEGSAGGRAVVCKRTELLGTRVMTRDCLVRCRLQEGNLDRDVLREAVDEAAKEGFDYFVLATTAGVDEVTRNWAAHAARDRGSWIVLWEAEDLETLLDKHQDLRFRFLSAPLSADYLLRHLNEDRSRGSRAMTPIVQMGLVEACTIALEDDQSLTLAHLFLVLLNLDVECTCKLVAEMGGDLSILRENLISIIMEQPETPVLEYGLVVSNSVRDAVDAAIELTESFGHDEISEKVLLLAMTSLEESYSIRTSLKSVNIDFHEYARKLLSAYFTDSEGEAFEAFGKQRQSERRSASPRAFRTFDTMKIEAGGVLRQLDARKKPSE